MLTVTVASLTPWYRTAVPREDLRKKRPLDAAQFAVHLDRVAAGDAPAEYTDPERFLSRTFLTDGLKRFTGEVLRRLAGEREGSNAVLNLVTGFGGGKTHALTLLYHLARSGPSATTFPGVPDLLQAAQLGEIPGAAAVVFVGTDWDAVTGRGGDDESLRRTPWGEMAWQLAQQTGDPKLFEAVAQQDAERIAPGKEAIRRFIPGDRPVLILMDEVMNFMTRGRGITVGKTTLASQFYEFVHALTEEADSRTGLCVVVSLPKSEEEMSADDQGDFQRLSKVTTRVAEPYVLAKDLEIPEIVRRRLFDSVGGDEDVKHTARSLARWLDEHRDSLPTWFPVDHAQEIVDATYPFHPTTLSVFERKWQALPSFQRTRGILRLLAQWVSIAYATGFEGAHEDALVGLGTAPLEDQFFRAAVLEQLGNEALQAAILSDVAGDQAHADRLDTAPGTPETLRKARVHRKVASAIFFESSGGQVKDRATLPEIRLAVGEPGLDLGNVETALEALTDASYFLNAEGGGYRFSTKPNLNKLLADRRAALDPSDVEEEGRSAVRKVFDQKKGMLRAFDVVAFPAEGVAIADAPGVRLVVLAPADPWSETTRAKIEGWMSEHGASPRRFPNSLVFSVPEESSGLSEAARRSLAWRLLAKEADARGFDEQERAEVDQQRRRSERDLVEAVWRSYRWLVFLGHDGSLTEEDLGLLHSSAAESMQDLIQKRLRQRDELTDALNPNRVIQNWPPALPEWTTKALRDTVYASPAFTRLMDPEALKDTVSRGMEQGLFGYGLRAAQGFVRVLIDEPLPPGEVEFSDDVVLLQPEQAKALKALEPSPEAPVGVTPEEVSQPGEGAVKGEQGVIFTGKKVVRIKWRGEIPPTKWTQFYTKVLSPLSGEGGLTLEASFESEPPTGLLQERVDRVRQALEDLGLHVELEVEEPSEQEEPLQ